MEIRKRLLMTSHTHSIRLFFAIISMLLLNACVTERPAPAQPLRLYVLDCGSIEVLDVSVYHPGIGKGEHKTLADSCYLIVHPNGSLLWDAGLPDGLVHTPEGKTVYNTFTMRVTRTLVAQLQEIGHGPETVGYLGVSHMHADHIGNVGLFPHATLLIQKEEYAAAFGPDAGKFGFDPALYPSLRSNPVKMLAGDHDVFGDGTVIIKRTPGHTPGHQALYVKLPKTGNILLSGDLVHFTDNWLHKRVPGFNFDKERSLKTMQEVEGFLKENQATLWIQHDLEQNAGIQHAPAYYE
jgi:N-acyl homoserine lactone hydrolase